MLNHLPRSLLSTSPRCAENQVLVEEEKHSQTAGKSNMCVCVFGEPQPERAKKWGSAKREEAHFNRLLISDKWSPWKRKCVGFFSLPSAVWPERRTIHLLAASIGPSCGFFTTSLSAARVALPLTVRPIQTGECAGGGEYWHCSPFPAPIVLIRLRQREKTSSNLHLLCPHVANLPFSDQPRADYRFISLGSRMQLGTMGVFQVGDCGRRWGRPDRCKSFNSSENWSKLGPHSLPWISCNTLTYARYFVCWLWS